MPRRLPDSDDRARGRAARRRRLASFVLRRLLGAARSARDDARAPRPAARRGDRRARRACRKFRRGRMRQHLGGGDAVGFMRANDRAPGELRAVLIQRRYTKHAEGSVLVGFGDTRVLCTASVEERVPPFLKDSGRGWVTAEYGMLPRSTNTRTEREAARGKQSGRTQEIQRLIGRALRAVVDLRALGQRTVQIDCDVLQADGGTRTAAITGSFVALSDAVTWLIERKLISQSPIRDHVAAVSVGMANGTPMLDLDYSEDSASGCDLNVVMTGSGRFVEVQGTAEGEPFSRAELDALLALAAKGIAELVQHQKKSFGV